MGRLLDERRFKGYLQELDKEKTYTVEEIIEMLDAQPTAYDLDFVTSLLTDLPSTDLDYTQVEDLVDRKSVIYIVRKGGK